MKDYMTSDGRIKRKWICMAFRCPGIVLIATPKPGEDKEIFCPYCGSPMIKETFSGDIPLFVERF
jgi:DNA-directed RNA polymerase subunit RPC12/RpoP